MGVEGLLIGRGGEISGIPEEGKYCRSELANFKGPYGRSGNCILFKEMAVLPSQLSATFTLPDFAFFL